MNLPCTTCSSNPTASSGLPEHCSSHTGADIVPASMNGEDLDRLLTETGLPPLGIEGPLPDPPENRTFWGDAGVLRLNEGCPFSCDYCASGVLHAGFKPGDPEKAFDQFKRLYRAGLRDFAFYDDALLIKSGSVLVPFLEKILDSDMRPSFHTPNAVHVSRISPNIADLMKRAGFREVRLGYESSSPDFHASHGTKYREESFRGTVETLRRAGFASSQIAVYILAGLPEQSSTEVRDSLREACEGKVRIHIAEFSPVPGSPLWEKCVAKSRYPLAEEPLFHNNTFFPMEWEGFCRGDLISIKRDAAAWNRSILAPLV